MMGCIYLVANKVNGKLYVGKTTQTRNARKKAHEKLAMNGNGFVFHKALRKYGLDNFEWNISESN